MSPADLSNELGISSANARQLLHRMAKDGEIQKGKFGHYFHKAVTLVTPSHKPTKASKNNLIANGGDSVTGVTASVEVVAPITLPTEGYLGPPGDDPADLLGDILGMPTPMKRSHNSNAAIAEGTDSIILDSSNQQQTTTDHCGH